MDGNKEFSIVIFKPILMAYDGIIYGDRINKSEFPVVKPKHINHHQVLSEVDMQK